jgi:hypothetical protein
MTKEFNVACVQEFKRVYKIKWTQKMYQDFHYTYQMGRDL